MVSQNFNFVLFAVAGLLSHANAFWRMNCGKINVGRMDPIVNPGKVSAHAHTFVGSNNVGINSTFESLSTAQCTSCEIQDDKSAYWTPEMYYQYANGSFYQVPHDGSVIYYIGRGEAKNNLTAFPPGFRMVSGDAGLRSYDSKTMTYSDATHAGRPIADRVSFNCLNATALPETPGFPSPMNCINGLRAQLHFQSCWNGRDNYTSDNSHVAYMSDIDNGVCPPTHPVALVHLFMETVYPINKITQEAGGRFVFSMGDPTGYGFHGDFQNGWNISVLAAALDASGQNCASDPASDGEVGDCPALAASDITNAASQCPIRPSPVNETVTGWIGNKLPGCFNIVNGPWRANASDMNCPSSVTPPYVTPTADTKVIQTAYPVVNQPFGNPGWNYVGCSNDTQGYRALGGPTYTNASGNSVQVCQSYCQTKGYKYAGVEYASECYCDNYLYNNPIFGQSQCYYMCPGNNTENCGGTARVDIYVRPDFPAPPAPTAAKTSGTYVRKGCYKEVSGRALAAKNMAADTVTVDTCAKYCLAGRYKYFGVEYGRECYCDNTLNSASTLLADSTCNMRCAGNYLKTQQWCGGSGALSLYYSANP